MSEQQEIIDLSGDAGVTKEILQFGKGEDTPNTGCKVSLHYTGKLTDGTVFDSSVERGEPFEFDLGKGQVIKAFDLGVASMKLGEKCILTCASQYAYGPQGSGKIPPNSTLVFELEMLSWKNEDISPDLDGSIERLIIKASEKKRTPTEGATIKIHLVGQYNGNTFEEREVEFPYGEGSPLGIIEGVEIGIGKMAVGEIAKFKVQPKYAWSNDGNNKFNIPPNATVEYVVNLIECEKGLEEWKMNTSERIQQATVYKDKGTNYYKSGNYKLAIKMYKKSLEFVNNENTDESQQLRIASHSNMALCYQKSDSFFEGKQACDEVLKLDPKNIKAYFRRGQCNLATNEFQAAIEDFEKVLTMEPDNKAAANQIQICKFKIKENNRLEKKIYANMFAKFAAADDQPVVETETDVLSKCGEWTEDEATRHEMDLAFERDNNIFLIE